MENKSFEQRVQEEMAGVWMKPDAKLWPEIARHLDQKKRRRGLIWWCFLGVLAGAGGWAVLLNSPSENKPSENKKTTTGTTMRQPASAGEMPEKGHRQNPLELRPVETAENQPGSALLIEAAKDVVQSRTLMQRPEARADVLVESNRMTDSIHIAGEAPAEVVQTGIGLTNKVQQNAGLPDLPGTDSIGSDSAVSEPAISKKTPWKWSFNLSAGVSGVRNDLFIVNKSAAFLDLAYNSSPSPGGGSGGNAGGIVVPVPVILKDAAAAEAAIQLSRDWDQHWGWYGKFGYNYAQYRLIYNDKDYYNRFHLLGITAGFTYSFQLRSGGTIGLNTGLQESLLLGYSATQLPDAANLPNKRMADFQKSQTALVFGMEAGFGKSRRFYLGPQFRYQLNQLSSVPGSDQHLVYILLQARWQIIKK
ncbi:MAG: hypothetical protein WAZ36_11265 [Sediminibacterium sp.]